MSQAQIERLYRDAQYYAQNATGSLAERSRIEADVLRRVLDGGRA